MRLWTTFVLAFSALLPLINPFGTALIFLGLVGEAPGTVYRTLARKVAINNIVFLTVIGLLGTSILKFFGISIPIVQLSGGLVIVGTGWSMLNRKSAQADAHADRQAAAEALDASPESFYDRSFYPLTFPITSGPGTLVVTLTLSAHDATQTLASEILGHVGLLLAVAAMSVLIYYCYSYAPRLARVLPASTVNGVLRVMAFIVLCIGAQIAWNGVTGLLNTPHPAQ